MASTVLPSSRPLLLASSIPRVKSPRVHRSARVAASLRSSLCGETLLQRKGVQHSQQQQQQQQWQQQGRRQLRVSAMTSDTYWVTVAQAVSVVVGIAASGVVTGLLLRYKCWRDAQGEVQSLIDQGKTPEEILSLATEELREQGIVLPKMSSGGDETGEGASFQEVPGLTVPTGADVALSSSLAGASAGRRKRPKQAE